MHFSSRTKKERFHQKIYESIEKELNNIDVEVGNEYLAWLEKKTKYFNKSLNKAGYITQPDNLSRGDIIWVEFGINIGTELSDFQTKGHYAIAWIIDLGNVVVIPLTSQKPTSSELTFDLGIIEGLDDKEAIHSYLKLDAIRSISKRRIRRLQGKKEGKVTLSSKKIEEIKKIIYHSFIL